MKDENQAAMGEVWAKGIIVRKKIKCKARRWGRARCAGGTGKKVSVIAVWGVRETEVWRGRQGPPSSS